MPEELTGTTALFLALIKVAKGHLIQCQRGKFARVDKLATQAPRRLEQPAHYRRRCALPGVTFTYRDYRHGSQLKELTLDAQSSSGASACISCLRDWCESGTMES